MVFKPRSPGSCLLKGAPASKQTEVCQIFVLFTHNLNSILNKWLTVVEYASVSNKTAERCTEGPTTRAKSGVEK